MRLAIVATHPIQYQVPWYRKLAAREDVELTVLYGLVPDAERQGTGFGVPFEWDVPLLDGYEWEVLDNALDDPGLDGFRASSTPGVEGALRRLAPDAVVITGWHQLPMLQALRAASRLRIPRLVRGESNALRRRPWSVRAVHRVLLRRFDAFLAIGSQSRAFYRGYGIPDERIFAVPYFVDNERFAAQAEEEMDHRPRIREAWGIPPEATCFVFAGKLEAKKHPLDLLAAIDLARGEVEGIHGLVVGAGPLMEAARELVDRRGLPVTFTGFLNQTEISAAYVAADCLVLPSDTGETWGLVVNEAMACGRPAVVSDEVGCAPDLVRSGVTGETFARGDVEALARVLVRLARAPGTLVSMGESARRHVARFSVEAAVDGTVAALRHVIGGHGADGALSA